MIVGLGNPDKAYQGNRHNVGFMCVERFAGRHHIQTKHRQSHSRVGTGEAHGCQLVIAKPQTYMNLSGEAVSSLKYKYGIEIEDIIIVHDDMDLPLGKIRLRQSGSSGGHRGIKSIIDCLGTQEFARLKIGIGHPGREGNGDDVVNYVLGDFHAGERDLVSQVLDTAGDALDFFITDGFGDAANRFNRVDLRRDVSQPAGDREKP